MRSYRYNTGTVYDTGLSACTGEETIQGAFITYITYNGMNLLRKFPRQRIIFHDKGVDFYFILEKLCDHGASEKSGCACNKILLKHGNTSKPNDKC